MNVSENLVFDSKYGKYNGIPTAGASCCFLQSCLCLPKKRLETNAEHKLQKSSSLYFRLCLFLGIVPKFQGKMSSCSNVMNKKVVGGP